MQEQDTTIGTATRGAAPGEANPRRDPDALQEDIHRRRENLDETLSALEHRLSPDQLVSQVMAYLRGGPTDYLGNLAQTARDNPVPVALTGIGLAWLMMSQSTEDTRPKRGREASDRGYRDDESWRSEEDRASFRDYYAHYLSQAHPFEQDEIDYILYEDLGPEDTEGVSSARWRTELEGTAGGTPGEDTRSSVQRLSDAARERLDRTRERMSSAGSDIQDRIREARRLARRQARGAYHSAKDTARYARDRVGEIVHEYPLAISALGIAAGAMLGGALPSTRTENRLMGTASDRVKTQAKRAGQEQAEHLVQAAGAVGEAVSKEAKEQGLTGEGMASTVRDLGERAERVMHAAGEEAERQGLTGKSDESEATTGAEKPMPSAGEPGTEGQRKEESVHGAG